MGIKCNYCQSNKVVKNGFTDTDKQCYLCKFCHNKSLIAEEFHSTKFRAMNHIERNHLKRLNRKTLCFSRSL